MSHVYDSRAEDAARAAMMRAWGLDPAKHAAHITPPAPEEPELVKLYQNLTPEQRAMPATYDALVYATNRAVKFVFEITAQLLAEEARRTDKRVNASAAKIVRLEASIAELTGQIGDLTHQLERERASRGADGRELPSSLMRAKPRAALKRKPPKQ
jgi:predicted AAA+ superfamily ATPase